MCKESPFAAKDKDTGKGLTPENKNAKTTQKFHISKQMMFISNWVKIT